MKTVPFVLISETNKRTDATAAVRSTYLKKEKKTRTIVEIFSSGWFVWDPGPQPNKPRESGRPAERPPCPRLCACASRTKRAWVSAIARGPSIEVVRRYGKSSVGTPGRSGGENIARRQCISDVFHRYRIAVHQFGSNGSENVGHQKVNCEIRNLLIVFVNLILSIATGYNKYTSHFFNVNANLFMQCTLTFQMIKGTCF